MRSANLWQAFGVLVVRAGTAQSFAPFHRCKDTAFFLFAQTFFRAKSGATLFSRFPACFVPNCGENACSFC